GRSRSPSSASLTRIRHSLSRRSAKAPVKAAGMCWMSTSGAGKLAGSWVRSEEHTSELQSRENLVCRLRLEKKKRRSDATRQVHAHAFARLFLSPLVTLRPPRSTLLPYTTLFRSRDAAGRRPRLP